MTLDLDLGVTKMAAPEHLRRASAANAGSFLACASSDDGEDVEPQVEPWESKKQLHRSTVFGLGPLRNSFTSNNSFRRRKRCRRG